MPESRQIARTRITQLPGIPHAWNQSAVANAVAFHDRRQTRSQSSRLPLVLLVCVNSASDQPPRNEGQRKRDKRPSRNAKKLQKVKRHGEEAIVDGRWHDEIFEEKVDPWCSPSHGGETEALRGLATAL